MTDKLNWIKKPSWEGTSRVFHWLRETIPISYYNMANGLEQNYFGSSSDWKNKDDDYDRTKQSIDKLKVLANELDGGHPLDSKILQVDMEFQAALKKSAKHASKSHSFQAEVSVQLLKTKQKKFDRKLAAKSVRSEGEVDWTYSQCKVKRVRKVKKARPASKAKKTGKKAVKRKASEYDSMEYQISPNMQHNVFEMMDTDTSEAIENSCNDFGFNPINGIEMGCEEKRQRLSEPLDCNTLSADGIPQPAAYTEVGRTPERCVEPTSESLDDPHSIDDRDIEIPPNNCHMCKRYDHIRKYCNRGKIFFPYYDHSYYGMSDEQIFHGNMHDCMLGRSAEPAKPFLFYTISADDEEANKSLTEEIDTAFKRDFGTVNTTQSRKRKLSYNQFRNKHYPYNPDYKFKEMRIY